MEAVTVVREAVTGTGIVAREAGMGASADRLTGIMASADPAAVTGMGTVVPLTGMEMGTVVLLTEMAESVAREAGTAETGVRLIGMETASAVRLTGITASADPADRDRIVARGTGIMARVRAAITTAGADAASAAKESSTWTAP